ncbi:hypothetical protein [Agriterribacter sp.]|uniref:hypothetical protein n=1 Tax=Agriterribacter sp. TaxID=2821509 RepID=UPI002C85580A|nr:hypothetical protein [Agriterribacter sp.]HRO44651.1 hypothetical protein [Agriterribacter sp.]HRQ16088.1 hypothetical protein [Agriterribacter sp.]
MNECFELPVHYKGEELLLPAELQAWGYSYRIRVSVNDQVITFEPDEECNYRALTDDTGKIPDIELIRSVANSIHSAFNEAEG